MSWQSVDPTPVSPRLLLLLPPPLDVRVRW